MPGEKMEKMTKRPTPLTLQLDEDSSGAKMQQHIKGEKPAPEKLAKSYSSPQLLVDEASGLTPVTSLQRHGMLSPLLATSSAQATSPTFGSLPTFGRPQSPGLTGSLFAAAAPLPAPARPGNEVRPSSRGSNGSGTGKRRGACARRPSTDSSGSGRHSKQSGTMCKTPNKGSKRLALTLPGLTRHQSSPSLAASPVAAAMLRRRVVFCPTPQNSTHVITPYASVYGRHPRFFDFDRKGEMRLNDEGLFEEMRQQEKLILMNQIVDMSPD